jgi:pseudo-rSAM protein
MRKSYWFYMEPYVHIAVKQGNALVYNTLNGKTIEEENPVIVNLIKKIDSKKNLSVIKLSEAELAEPVISNFVKRIREHFSGDLIDTSCSKGKPIQMLPRVKIQKDVEEAKPGGESAVGEGILDNLTELTLYISNRCGLNCPFCKNAFKQFLTCTKNNTNKPQELKLEDIIKFLNESQGSPIHRLNIVGGDIFSYSKFGELCRFLNDYKKFKTYHNHYLNLQNRESELKLINNQFSSFVVYVDFPIEEDKLKSAAGMFERLGIDREYVFVIQEEEEIEPVQAICNRLKITNFAFKPYYNGENFNFFKDNVFMEKQALFQLKPDAKQIFSRIKTNPLNFGRITVLSNGAVYANMNEKKIGEFEKDSIYDITLRELFDGKSWRKTRDKVKPCKSCVYCFLCPPLTNYEYALKQNNLCHIRGASPG